MTETIEPYHNDISLPPILICDIDGTMAIKHPDRGIHDYHMVELDLLNKPVHDVVRLYDNAGVEIIFITGRRDDCRNETQQWLDEKTGVPGAKLYMRSTGDRRQDYIVKYELFQKHIADKYHVALVLEDRNQVVDLWRNKLGLPTFQVANGDF